MQNELLKYIKGKCSEKEKDAILTWIRQKPEHQQLYNKLKAEYVSQQLSNKNTIDLEVPYKKFRAETTNKNNYIRTIAAAAVILFGTVYLFNTLSKDISNNTHINIVSSENNVKKITLPDGSTVQLNAKSSVTYPNSFKNDVREISLDGEAFFDVKHNPSKPFIVKTKRVDIKVLGTTFNIKSYDNDEQVETTLVSGKVEVINTESSEKSLILAPSEKAILDKNDNNIIVEKVNSLDVIAWQKGKLVFKNTSLKQVVKDLSRKYNVEFVVKSKELLDYHFTGVFDNLSLTDALELLKISSKINYKVVEKKIFLDLKK